MIQGNSMNMPYAAEARLRQERIEAFHVSKDLVQERYREKIILDELMLEAYWAKLDQLRTYNQNAQMEKVQAEQGLIIDMKA